MTAPKKTRTRNPKQTRAKLLQATIALVAAKGADALSLKEAARLAKVSRGVVYQHFEDREHLLRAAKARLLEELTESVQQVEFHSMEEHVFHVSNLVLKNPEAASLLVTDALAGKARNIDHPLYKLVVKSLEGFKDTGYAPRDIDVEIQSHIMLGSVATLVMLSRLRKGRDTSTLALRYTTEWTRILRSGIFSKSLTASAGTPPKKKSRSRK